MPSMLKSPSAEKQRPWTNTPFWIALVPLWDRPWAQKDVHSSLEISSRKPSCSGKYWAIQPIKSAHNCSFRSDATFFIFLEEIPACMSSQWIVVCCSIFYFILFVHILIPTWVSPPSVSVWLSFHSYLSQVILHLTWSHDLVAPFIIFT